jgi:RNA polymerase sigma-70 factor, ECF subfamily
VEHNNGHRRHSSTDTSDTSRETSLSDAPDRDLVMRALRKDEIAVAELVHRYTPPLYSLAYRALQHHSDAEETVQDIFLKAFDSLERFDPERSFFPWIYTIGINHIRSLRRSPAFWKRQDTLPIAEELVSAATRDNPEHEVLAQEMRRVIDVALQKLRPVERRVFTLRKMEGLSTDETARLLSLSANTIKTHLRRARKKMEITILRNETLSWVHAYRKEENGK